MTTDGQRALRKLLAAQARAEAGERDVPMPLSEGEARALLAALSWLEDASGAAGHLRDQLAEMLKVRTH